MARTASATAQPTTIISSISSRAAAARAAARPGSPPGQPCRQRDLRGISKPSWQSGLFGNPDDSVRDIPDVSLFAANGVWNHYYVVCWSHTGYGGIACYGDPSGWPGGGGTSFASPIMAGIQALVNQYTGSRQGNPNPTYYSLAKTEYGSSGDASCNSTLGNGVAGSCIFYDVTEGDMDVPCTGTNECYTPSGTYGVLSTSNSAYQPAYGTQTGWDFATGIGTVNAYNLVMAFGTSPPPTPTTLSASPATIKFGSVDATGTTSRRSDAHQQGHDRGGDRIGDHDAAIRGRGRREHLLGSDYRAEEEVLVRSRVRAGHSRRRERSKPSRLATTAPVPR